MNDMQSKVREWMLLAQQECPERPVLEPTKEIQDLRYELIKEELEEFDKAQCEHSRIEITDAIGDLLYVVLGTAVAYGIDIEPIFNGIHRSNMSKFIDGHRREDGKWIKGPSYSPANLQPILDQQVAERKDKI